MSSDQAAVAFDRERPHLLAVAFRILGSDADAQDVVQDAWTRYARADPADIRNTQAWLTTVVTRLCLDVLRRSHETPRRPEELPTPATGESPAAGENPEDVALLAAELTAAFTVVVEELTPPQRVALILHDVFGAPFDEIAHILDTTPGSAKKLASRARGRVRRTGWPDAESREADRVVTAFMKAAQQGDIDGLVEVLHPDVVRTADPQVLRPGAPQRVHGIEAVVEETRAMRSAARRARLARIDGRPGIAVGPGRPRAALVFHIAGGLIVRYDVVADPRRLALLHIED
ncbi:sigma-70 family RNA polymerase sigma factor [Actinomadura sp. NAK00032]|uniref:sigma-70 family RNA polymerase sigma factor n=1 Tax=Actinomadura sp. NAK00032 TaxID=2742128 RepID=UPI001590FF16|nr:sigma-70 family RNA polymerase sigma factor [Actinomadura sp. NAK00032]QKW32804.1 sigma-70 family RNA polymerase sigma factor [Actinomadura sp. NAK00032]